MCRRPASFAVWDKVMLEVYCWCPEQQLQQLLATFPYAQAGLTAPNPTVLRSWNYSAYMLSSSVTNCYGAAQWGWDNISSTAAVTQAEQAWREGEPCASRRMTCQPACCIPSAICLTLFGTACVTSALRQMTVE